MWPIIAMIVGTAMQIAGSAQSARAVRKEEDRMNELMRQHSLEGEKNAQHQKSDKYQGYNKNMGCTSDAGGLRRRIRPEA